MDSSVIFLVVLGLWAAYLVPHWLRRREDLSQSRTVDRFSAAMRVLPRPSASARRPERPRTPAYVLAPAREQVALPAGHRSAGADPAAEVPVPVAAPPGPAVAGRRAPARRGRALARTLAVVLLVSVLAVPALGVLSVLGLAPAWAAAPAAALVGLTVAALRASARRRTAARTATPVQTVAVIAPDEVVAAPAQDPAPVPREELFDEQEHTAREEQARIRRLAEEALRAADVPYREPEPGEWTPVAVPLPAYLLKPHARPAWQPVQAAPPAARPAADVDDDDIPTYAPPVRRVAGA